MPNNLRKSFFFILSRRKKEFWGGLQCPSGYLFIYLFKCRGRAQTQKGKKQSEKGSSSSLFFLVKGKQKGGRNTWTRACKMRTAEEPFFVLLLFFYLSYPSW